MQSSGIYAELESVVEDTRTSSRPSSRTFADHRSVAATFASAVDACGAFWTVLATDRSKEEKIGECRFWKGLEVVRE